MNRNIVRYCAYITIIFLASCGLLQERNLSVPPSVSKKLEDSVLVKKLLYSQYEDWRGVRYQKGGLNQSGIDCSGFVHLTYKSKLGMHLPRTTSMQAKLGKQIHKNDLKAGDLIFFKTGSGSNHVGIYLENNRFMHASQKKGVTISRLDHAYWITNYWKSVRI